MSTQVPSVDDARRAARVLRDAGARKVILFGSVVRDQQTETSDIDLAAIFDDIDYSKRQACKQHLEEQAAQAAGFPVNVHVIDFPAWCARLEHLPGCFEGTIAASGSTLVDLPPVLPPSRSKDTYPHFVLSRFEEAEVRLRALVGHLERTWSCVARESQLEPTSDPEADLSYRSYERLRQLAGLEMTFEAALKALLNLYTITPPRTRSTAEWEMLLPEPHRSAVVRMRGGLPNSEFRGWRPLADNYGDYRDDAAALAVRLVPIAVAVTQLTAYTADAYDAELCTEWWHPDPNDLRDAGAGLTKQLRENTAADADGEWARADAAEVVRFDQPQCGALVVEVDPMERAQVLVTSGGYTIAEIAELVDQSPAWVSSNTANLAAR